MSDLNIEIYFLNYITYVLDTAPHGRMVDRSNIQKLAYTLKARKRAQCDSKRYQLVMKCWRAFHDAHIDMNSYEYDKQSRLHAHGIISIKGRIPYRVFQVEGYVVHIRPLRTEEDVQAWTDYCNKDQDLTKYIQSPTKEDPKMPRHSLFKSH